MAFACLAMLTFVSTSKAFSGLDFTTNDLGVSGTKNNMAKNRAAGMVSEANIQHQPTVFN